MHDYAINGLAAAHQNGSGEEVAEWEHKVVQIGKMLEQADLNSDA